MALLQTPIFIMAILGNVLSILVFASPLPTFWCIWKSKSSQDLKCHTYVFTLLSTSLWTYYGLIKPNATFIFTANLAGTAFHAFYVLFFLIFYPTDKKIQIWLLAFLLNFVFFGAVTTFTMLLIHDSSQRILVVGVFCASISISMYATPLLVMRTIIRTRSVEHMPLLFSVCLFFNAIVWMTYAFLVKDIFIKIPNIIGVVLGASQLLMYIVFKNYKALRKDGSRKGDAKMKEYNSHEIHKGATIFEDIDDKKDGITSLPKQYSGPKVIRSTSLNLSNTINIMDDDSSNGAYERAPKKTNG